MIITCLSIIINHTYSCLFALVVRLPVCVNKLCTILPHTIMHDESVRRGQELVHIAHTVELSM